MNFSQFHWSLSALRPPTTTQTQAHSAEKNYLKKFIQKKNCRNKFDMKGKKMLSVRGWEGEGAENDVATRETRRESFNAHRRSARRCPKFEVGKKSRLKGKIREWGVGWKLNSRSEDL
jgi:hypothetical protein